METLKFTTNINCGGCIAKVTPFLDNKEGIEKSSKRKRMERKKAEK